MSKILLLDIETLPQLGYSWTSWDANILHVKEPWSICGFSAKWIGGEHITKVLPDYPQCRGDRALVKDLWKLLDEADIVVAHNGNKFDIRKINSRFLVHGFNPPAPYRTVDTLREAKRIFGFTSNKLGDLCQQLGIGGKTPHAGFQMWLDCMNGDKAAWQKMRDYNENDVILLEKLYYKMLPWMRHPAVTQERDRCTVCGSAHIQYRGTRMNETRWYKRYVCQTCGHWLQSTKSEGQINLKII